MSPRRASTCEISSSARRQSNVTYAVLPEPVDPALSTRWLTSYSSDAYR